MATVAEEVLTPIIEHYDISKIYIRIKPDRKKIDLEQGVIFIFHGHYYEGPTREIEVTQAFGCSLPNPVSTWKIPEETANELILSPEGNAYAEIQKRDNGVHIYFFCDIIRNSFPDQRKIFEAMCLGIFKKLEDLGLIREKGKGPPLPQSSPFLEAAFLERHEHEYQEIAEKIEIKRAGGSRRTTVFCKTWREVAKLRASIAKLQENEPRQIEKRQAEFDSLLKHPQLEAIGLENSWILIRTKPIIITCPPNKTSTKAVRFNIGRWLIKLNLTNGVVRVFPADGQKRIATMLHPHVYNKNLPDLNVEANQICWGSMSSEAERFAKEKSYGLLITLVFLILSNCNTDDQVSMSALKDIGRVVN